VALQLHVEPVAENILQALDTGPGKIDLAFADQAVDRTCRAAGQRDEAGGVVGERGDGGPWLARRFAVEPGARDEPHQLLVAGLVAGDEDEAAGAGDGKLEAARRRRTVAEIDAELHADDRLHALLGELLGKFQRAEQIVGVGDGQRRLLVGDRELGQPGDAQRALAKRIGRVDVQVHETDVATNIQNGLRSGGRTLGRVAARLKRDRAARIAPGQATA